jgi:hypothetical protein
VREINLPFPYDDEPLLFRLLTLFFAFFGATEALAALLAVLRRGFRFVFDGALVVSSPDDTNAASFPAALPIVVAAFIRTPFAFLGATFFFAIF